MAIPKTRSEAANHGIEQASTWKIDDDKSHKAFHDELDQLDHSKIARKEHLKEVELKAFTQKLVAQGDLPAMDLTTHNNL